MFLSLSCALGQVNTICLTPNSRFNFVLGVSLTIHSFILGQVRSVWIAILVVETLTAAAYDILATTGVEVSTSFLAS